MAPNAQATVLQIRELVDNIISQCTLDDPMDGLPATPAAGEWTGIRPLSLDVARDMPSLRSLSLVSKAWHRLATPHIFHTFYAEFGRREEETIGPWPNGGRTAPLLRFLHFAPHIRAVIRVAYLYVSPTHADSERACHKAFDRIVAMLPRLQMLQLSGPLTKCLGTPGSPPIHHRKFPQSLRKLVLNDMEIRTSGSGYEYSVTLMASDCHLQSLRALLAQFGTVKELVVGSANLLVEGAETPGEPSWKLQSLVCNGFRFRDLTALALSQLCTGSTTALHLTEGAGTALAEIVKNIPTEVASNLEHLSVWIPDSSPGSSNISIKFIPFDNLQHFSMHIRAEHTNSFSSSRKIISSLLSTGKHVRLLEFKIVANLNLKALCNHLYDVDKIEALQGLEEDLKNIAERKGTALRVGFYHRRLPIWHGQLCLSTGDEVKELFPKLNKLGYLR